MITVRKLPALLALAVVLAACSTAQMTPATTLNGIPPPSHPLPVVMTSATPTGWIPVELGDAQVSIPKSWNAVYPGAIDCGDPAGPGFLLVGAVRIRGIVGCPPNARENVNATTANIIRLRLPRAMYSREASKVVNGVRVYVAWTHTAGTLSYYAPSLDAELSAEGPLAAKVYATFGASPRFVALSGGRAPPLPSSWKSARFSGLRLSYPSTWSLNRTNLSPGGCGGTPDLMFYSANVTLSTDTFPNLPVCPTFPPRLPDLSSCLSAHRSVERGATRLRSLRSGPDDGGGS